MSINLKNIEAEQLLKTLANETGESLTQAAATAFRERLERLQQARAAGRKRSLDSLLDLVVEARAAPLVDGRPSKEIDDELWADG